MATIPPAISHHYGLVREQEAHALATATRQWRKLGPNWIAEAWADRVPTVAAAVTAAQRTAAASALVSGALALGQQDTWAAPDGLVDPGAFAGLAADGRDLEKLLNIPARTTRRLIGQGMDAAQALEAGERQLTMMVLTEIADAGRGAAGVQIAARPRVGYVRMLEPPSCSRCVILAGRFYRWNQGFLRHPRCDCKHVPTMVTDQAEAFARGLIDDPYEAFTRMSEAEQNRVFTNAGAQAIRDGADMYQVVNARRGMKYRGAFTSEGTSKHGWAGQILRRGQKRMTPETIYRLNPNREQAVEALRAQGYITGRGQVSGGALRGQYEATYEGRRMTAAERRVFVATRNWEEVQAGLNPYTAAAVERHGGARIGGQDRPLTPFDRARAEAEYYAAVASNGEAGLMRRLFNAEYKALAADI
nr:MAG TPA: minor capsid protein [Caudoviricetes sp.]